MNCMNTSREYKDGTFYFKKTLFHTYIRVKVNGYYYDTAAAIHISLFAFFLNLSRHLMLEPETTTNYTIRMMLKTFKFKIQCAMDD